MAEKIMIFGAGALAREALQIIRDLQASGNAVECCGFVVDPSIETPGLVKGLPIFRGLRAAFTDSDLRFVIALGDGRARARIAAELTRTVGPRFASLVHPKSWIGADVCIGLGCIIFGNTSVTTDVVISEHVVINPGSTVAHDVTIGSFATLSPGVDLAGHVRVGEGSMIGTGASVIPRIAIGSWAVVGAGAVVVRDVPDEATVVGVPARIASRCPDEDRR